jgi:K+/H+ antiporter YhaU regulatory subunit KhtT
VRQEVGGMVLTIQRADGGVIFDPSPDLRVKTGDTLFVVGSAGRNSES